METYVKPLPVALADAVNGAGMSRRQLEAAASVNRSTIGEIMRGRATRIDRARRLCSALGVPVESCFTYPDGAPLFATAGPRVTVPTEPAAELDPASVPGSREWWAVVTASKVAAMLGVSPYDSPRSLWHKMRGDVDTEPDAVSDVNDIRTRGHLLEPAVLAWWRQSHPDATSYREHPTVKLDALPWAAAGPDAEATLADGSRVFVEAKTAANADEWGTPGTDEIPVYYVAQALWQMALAPDVSTVFVPVILPRLEFAEYVVKRDDAAIADVLARVEAFRDSLTDPDAAPELDDSVATFQILKALHPDIDAGQQVTLAADVADAYRNADADAKAAESALQLAKNRVLDAMGRANYAHHPDGSRVARRQPNRTGVSLVAVKPTTR